MPLPTLVPCLISLVAVLLGLQMTSCSTSPDVHATSVGIPDGILWDRVELTGGALVHLRCGATTSQVRLTSAEPGPWARLRGTTLVLGDDRQHQRDVVWDLDTISIQSIDLVGAGEIDAHDIVADRLRAALPGSGTVRLHGSAQHLTLSLGGAGTIDASACPAATADIALTGAGTISVNAKDEVTGKLSGAGTLRLNTKPAKERLETSGAITVYREP